MLSFRQAEDSDRYKVMEIRNSGREFMTHHTEYITKEQQDAWWFSENRAAAYIWIVELDNTAIGFCMIREMYDSGRIYGTLAILPEYRRQGYGTSIYQFMTEQTDELWIDVRNDNVASMNAAINAGFEVHYIGPVVTELVYR